MYKTELHAHTAETSNCAHAPASELIEAYIDKGYSTVVITDHLSTHTYFRYNYNKLSWNEKIDIFLKGYEAALKAADGRINVILGMELRFDSPIENDYLVFGVNEKFLRKNLNLIDSKISKFSELAHKKGMLIYQAHPFRYGMTVIDPKFLDGIEVHNGCVRHNSNNDNAEFWADSHSLNKTSGSDYHQTGDEAHGGIITDYEIKTTEDLLRTLKGNTYELIK